MRSEAAAQMVGDKDAVADILGASRGSDAWTRRTPVRVWDEWTDYIFMANVGVGKYYDNSNVNGWENPVQEWERGGVIACATLVTL